MNLMSWHIVVSWQNYMTYDIKFSHVVAALLDSFSTSAEAGSVHASQRVISDCHPASRISVEYSLRTQFRRPFLFCANWTCLWDYDRWCIHSCVQVCRAVEALQQYHGTMKNKGKPQLVEDNPTVSLIVALRKIPDRSIRPHRMYVRLNKLYRW